MNENYTEIDLLDLCKTILKKWKILIACALVCAILGGVYGALQANKAKPETEEQVKALTADMTQEEIDNVKDAAEIINNYRAMYKTQKEYNENSIYQKLNPYSVDALKLSYYIDNHFKVSYPAIEESNNIIPIIQAYISSFSKDAFYEDLAKAVGEEGNPTYVKELVNIDTHEKESGMLTITIYASSDELLTKMGEHIKKSITEKQTEIAEVYGDHDIILASESAGKIVDTIMADTQSRNVERLTTITTNIANEEKLFTGNQLTFLKYLIHEEPDEKVSIPKNALIGAFLGAVIFFVYFAIRYVLDGNVKTKEELAGIFGTSSLGSSEADSELMALKISSIAEADECKKVALIYSDNDEYVKKIATLVKPEAVAVTGIMSDKDAFKAFSECDSMILFGKVKQIKKKNVVGLKALCADNKIKVLGVVGI